VSVVRKNPRRFAITLILREDLSIFERDIFFVDTTETDALIDTAEVYRSTTKDTRRSIMGIIALPPCKEANIARSINEASKRTGIVIAINTNAIFWNRALEKRRFQDSLKDFLI
jgi:hypothetical protein